nr:RhuM family protein [uncultured Prevotella sp.]
MTENLNDKIIIYQSEDGKTQLDVKLEGETMWLTQAQMVELFQTSKQNVSLHINNIYKEGELEKEATVKDYLTVQSEGARTIHRRVKYYNLDMIISVGYRVNTKRGIRFRQ